MEEIRMGHDVAKPTYEGMDKYPGIISTVLTLIIGGIFLGALYHSATSHHGGDHGDAHGSEHGAEHGEAHGAEGAAPEAAAH